MCTRIDRQPAETLYEGETRRLSAPSARGRCWGGGFPWWTLWLLWPLFALLKGATALIGPALGWLNQPVVLAIAPLPLLLIGAGVLLLVLGVARRSRQ